MLSKSGILIIRALAYLAGNLQGSYVGVTTIAKEIGSPTNYLSKLLQRLSRKGLLESQKGSGGGFRLARDARSISLAEVVESSDNISRWAGCFMGKSTCLEANPCRVHRQWKGIRNAYLLFLDQTKISDIVHNGKK